MTNDGFLKAISDSFKKFIEIGTSRSTAKLKPLHGLIANDIASMLGSDYKIFSQGYGEDKESLMPGRYFDKMVDITITKGDKAVCGIAVKFVMQNYSQNSNNYFENMLGETANIRSGKLPYFQVFVVLDKMPYYKKDKTISRWETFSDHNVSKYLMLSRDNTDVYFHTPNKMLIYVVHVKDCVNVTNYDEYRQFYMKNGFNVELSKHNYIQFDDTVILNDYKNFMLKVYHTILSL